MRTEKVSLIGYVGEEALDIQAITCDTHKFEYNAEAEIFTATFINGVDEDGDVVTKLDIAKRVFAGRTVLTIDAENIVIPVSEYEGMKETIAVLSDAGLVDEIAKAEADIAAGNLTTIN